MSKFMKTANDALAVIDRMEQETNSGHTKSAADRFIGMLKHAGLDDGDEKFVAKFARSFESYSTLSTEDLVKRALQRFLKHRNIDNIVEGMKSASNNERVWAKAAADFIGPQLDHDDPDTAAMNGELCKRAELGSAARIARSLSRRGAAAGRGAAVDIATGLPMRGAGAGMANELGAVGKGLGGTAAGAGMASVGGELGSAAREGGLMARHPYMASAGLLGAGAGGMYALGRAGFGGMGGRRDTLMQMLPLLAETGNPDTALAMIMDYSQRGGKIPDEMWQALREAIAYRRNPWARQYGFYG